MSEIAQSADPGFPAAGVLPEAAPAEGQAAPAPEGTPAGESEEAKARVFTQAELDAAVQRRVAKERRRFERELQGMLGQQQQAKETPKQDADEPKREQFQDYEAYLEARADWRAGRKAQEHVETIMAQRAQVSAQTELVSSAQEVIEKGRAQYKDFDTVVNAAFETGAIEPGGALHRALIQSDDGHKLAYHLATHPQEAERLGALAPARQLIELGRISARLEQPASRAPAPPKPLTGGAAPVEKDFTSLSPKEHLKWRRERRKGL